MGILLAFAPFLIFAVIERLIGPTLGLIAGALVSAALILRDWLNPKRSVKVLELGTVILFGVLALYSSVAKKTWSIVGVRLCVDAGLSLIVLVSIALGKPFTLQYAREQTPAELWQQPEFVRTNYVIAGVWAAAFALMVAADLIMLYVPSVPTKVGIWVTILAIVGAVKFTSSYPDGARPAANNKEILD
jgi:hypothetical protein